jgi:DNA-binding transcriptional regulator YiaG
VKYTPDKVKQVFDTLGYTSVTAADYLGVSYATTSSWLSGRRTPSDAHIDLMIARYLMHGMECVNDKDTELLKLFNA